MIMRKEYERFMRYKTEKEYGGPVDRNDMYKWQIHFEGPKDSDYEGAKLHIEVIFSDEYPKTMPKCKFINDTDIFHPNVRQDGTICFGKFIWKEDYTILNLLDAIIYLLRYPNFGDGYDNKQVADFFKADPESYHRTVREIVKEFLM